MDDVTLGVLSALDRIDVTAEAEKEDISVPVGQTYQTGAGVVDRYQTLSQMQMNVLNWASTRSPEYSKFVRNMVDSGFLPESAMDQPTSAANNLQYPVQVFQAYRAGGGQMVFNEWFDWYSSTARQQRGGTGGGGGGGGYTGPISSVSRMAESDIRQTATTIALELLGAPLEEKEMDRIIKKMRTAETEQPTVTTRTPSSVTTQEGLTATGRDQILRDLISQNPEYEQFQVDTTVLDSMLNFVNKKRQVSDG